MPNSWNILVEKLIAKTCQNTLIWSSGYKKSPLNVLHFYLTFPHGYIFNALSILFYLFVPPWS